jgi:hypothetical protein
MIEAPYVFGRTFIRDKVPYIVEEGKMDCAAAISAMFSIVSE